MDQEGAYSFDIFWSAQPYLRALRARASSEQLDGYRNF